MYICESKEELEARLKGAIENKYVVDADLLRGEPINILVHNAVFAKDEIKNYARELIKRAANQLGIKPASILRIYQARGKGEWGGITLPAINIRGLTYEVARALFRTVKKSSVGLFIFEIARSEIGYTMQSPDEYASVILAAAVKENYRGPIFLQGDHFQVRRSKFFSSPEDREKELATIKNLIKEALNSGFYQIDIDTSTLVNLDLPSLDEQQRDNYLTCAYLAEYIRKEANVDVAIGGEIGEIGGKNSTPEELRTFMNGYLRERGKEEGSYLVKIAVQTGTTHGGIPLPDGSIAQVKLDFNTLEELSRVARDEYKLAGVVQHGASTLPMELFSKFPAVETTEIHLATEFQNIIYKHLPPELKEEIYEFLKEKCASEWKEGDTEEQFLYKTRKKAFGAFKYHLWNLERAIIQNITKELEEKFTMLFSQLGVEDTVELLDSYIK